MRHIKRLRDRRDYQARRVLQEWAVMPARIMPGIQPSSLNAELYLNSGTPMFIPDSGSLEISRIPWAAEGARWRPRAGVRSAE